MTTQADSEPASPRRAGKSDSAFRTISEVSEDLDVPQHVLRFWESKFPQIKPLKRGGGRRYYRPEDLALLKRIRDLLYKDGYTIKGVQKLLREQGKSFVAAEAAASAANAQTAEHEPELEEDEAQPSLLDFDPAPQPEDVAPSAPWVEPAAAGPAPSAYVHPAANGAFRPGDRAELEQILAELEDLRDLIGTARRDR